MSTPAIRNLSISLILTSLAALLALGGCGTTRTVICPLGVSSSGTCGCGGVSNACIASQAIFADGLNGQIAGFPMPGGTGIPGSSTTTAGPANSLGMAALNNQFLYASSFPLALGQTSSIYAWSMDVNTATLTPVSGSPFSLGPLSVAGGLAVNPSAQVLYVGDAGTIDALQIGSTGALTPLPGSPFAAGSNVYLAVGGLNQFLFASDATPPGNVLAYTIGSTGGLTPVSGSPFATIPGYVGSTQPSQIVFDATGHFMYTGLLATGQIAGFSIDATTGALTAIPGSPFPAGSRPLSLATVSSFLYVSNVADGTISGYSIDPTTGALTQVASSPFAIPGGPLVASPFLTYLYTVSSGGLTALSVNPQTGALTQAGSAVPTAGATALTFVP